MARRVCAWCGKTLGIGPGPDKDESHGMCELCEVRSEAENALSHALIGVRAIEAELERTLADVWPPGLPLGRLPQDPRRSL